TALPGRRSAGDSDSRTHCRSLCPAVSGAVSVHRRPSVVEPRVATARCLAELLLALVARTDRIARPAAGIPLRMDSARARATGAPVGGPDACGHARAGRTSFAL